MVSEHDKNMRNANHGNNVKSDKLMPKEASKWDHSRIMRTESSTEANRGIEYPGKPRVAENKQAPRNRTAKNG
jgi:hypothetical protein